MLRFLDTLPAPSIEGFGASEAAAWAATHSPAAERVVLWGGPEVEGHPGARRRIGGVSTHPAATVLGLRGFDDAQEGLVEAGGEAVPYVIFDVEKLVRMLLHQSGLAFEILVSPVVLHSDASRAVPVKELVEAAITGDLVLHHRDIASPHVEDWRREGRVPDDLPGLFRVLLSGHALAYDAAVCLHLPTLASHHGADALMGLVQTGLPEGAVDLAALQALASELFDAIDAVDEHGAPALPSRPSAYDWLNDWLVARRLGRM